MNQFWKELALSILLGMVVPALLLQGAVTVFGREQDQIAQLVEPLPTVQPTTAPVLPASTLTVLVREGDPEPVRMNLDDYLTGVVLGEMPASFEVEALKAQAVVARTYALKASLTGGKHGDGSVCTQSVCCQSYISPEQYLSGGGTQESLNKIRQCVQETSDLVLTYDGTLIEATYFSCSGGSTEDAVAVWGTDFPYLRATESPGEENATHFTDASYFSASDFCSKLGLALTGSPLEWLGNARHTAGGGVAEMEICGTSFTGTQLRQLLGLHSTAITMTADEQGIHVQTRGYGHRVGMSQYGADAMAVSGSTFDQILAHYYVGTSLRNFSTLDN